MAESATIATTDHRGHTHRSPVAAQVKRGTAVGRYLVLDRIGAGAMGVVYRAYDPELDRRVAVKLIKHTGDPAAAPRLLREAQALAKLSHPNVVAIYDVGTSGDAVFLAMEYIDGHSLAHQLDAAPLGWTAAVEMFLEAARGLAAAHRVGLCHRDFKPANVIVSASGQVKVADFGLARPTHAINEAPVEDRDRLGVADADERLTASSATAGTPAYLAPEVHAGDAADARSDQFSFFVSFVEALTGERPYRSEGVGLQRAKEQGAPELPRTLPRWLRLVVARGLCPDPAGRFADLDAVVGALTRGRDRRRRTWMLGGIAAVTAVGAVAIAMTPAAIVCTDGAAHAQEAWNPERRSQVVAAILDTGMPYAGQTAQRIGDQLDAYTTQWGEATDEACAATHVRHTQSVAQLDQRQLCLDHALDETRALVELLTHADAAIAERAVAAVAGLTPIARCTTASGLLVGVAPPDQSDAARIADVRRRLAQVRALELAGQYERGLQEAALASTEAQALAYAPLLAEAEFGVGRLLERQGDIESALAKLKEAHWIAEGQRMDIVAANAATLVVFTLGSHGNAEEALEWGRHARTAVERVGTRSHEESELLNALGATRTTQGQPALARDLFAQALAIKREIYPSDHHQIPMQLGNLAIALEDLGELQTARADLEEALALTERALGPDHPQTAIVLFNLAGVVRQQGDVHQALEIHRRALRIKQATLPPGHPSIGYSLQGVASALRLTGHWREARAAHEQALAHLTVAAGPEHPRVAEVYNDLGIVQRLLGDLEHAEHSHRRALEIWRATLGPDHPHVAAALVNLGTIAGDAGDDEASLVLFTEAADVLRKSSDPSHPMIAATEASVGLALTVLGRVDEAREHLVVAHRLAIERYGEDDIRLAEFEDALAALEIAQGNDAAAQALLERALARRRSASDLDADAAKGALALAKLLHAEDPERARALAHQADGWFQGTELPAEIRTQARVWLDAHP